jgi:hypothetical protein
MSNTATLTKKTSPTSISLEKPLLKAAKQKAKKERRSFSSYIALLLEQDIANATKL